MSIDAATQGLGIALESTVIAAKHLTEGPLRPIFGLEKAVKVQAHFAVYPARHARPPSVQAFLAWMQEQARDV